MHIGVWSSTNCNSRGEAQVEFLNFSDLDILNQGNGSTFCSGSTFDVINITLWFFWFPESIIGWKVSSEHSLSDHRNIPFTLEGSTTVCLIMNPRGKIGASLEGT
jgi:hypothetical protein